MHSFWPRTIYLLVCRCHAALTSKTAQERLAHVLLEDGAKHRPEVAGGIELDITNEVSANSASITPYAASRMVTEWQLPLIHRLQSK